MLLGLSVVQLVGGLIAWRRGGVPGWVAVVSSVLLAASAVQVKLGFSRVLGVHIPLGVLIIAAVATLAVWVWRYAPTTPARHERRERA